MTATTRYIRALAGAVTLIGSGMAQAALITFTTQAAFEAATAARGTDTYADLSTTVNTSSPLLRSAGAYSYTATASSSSFLGGGSAANPFLAPNTATDSILINGFSPSITAIAGNFFTSDEFGAYLTGDVILTAVDSEGQVSQTLLDTSSSTYFGFLSTTSLVSLSLTAVQNQQPAQFVWASVDNLTLGQTASATVAEPATLALAAFGLLAAAGLRRRA